jgi:hypothetical protein
VIGRTDDATVAFLDELANERALAIACFTCISNVRQMKNMKGALPMAFLSGEPFYFFAFAFGGLLARAHARTGDAAVIAGYCGYSTVLDGALADWAEAYGEQTLKDHAALARAIKSGRVKAVHGL